MDGPISLRVRIDKTISYCYQRRARLLLNTNDRGEIEEGRRKELWRKYISGITWNNEKLVTTNRVEYFGGGFVVVFFFFFLTVGNRY